MPEHKLKTELADLALIVVVVTAVVAWWIKTKLEELWDK